MGVLDKWFSKKLLQNSEVIAKMSQYRFNSGLIDDVNFNDPEKIFTSVLLENIAWNSGIPENLEWFFKHTKPKLNGYSNKVTDSSFWHKVTPKTIRVHSGVPALISKTMINIIAGAGFDVTVEKDGEIDEEQTERLLEILKDNSFEERLLPDGVNAESYGGYFAYKISYDSDVSKYPIIEMASPENCELLVERNRVRGIIFKTIYKENKKNYERQEIYIEKEDGVLITYKKYEFRGVDKIEVKFYAEEVEKYQDVFISGIKLPAVMKNNTSTNTQFKASYYGLSDYSNSQSIFNSLDETMSQMMTAIRFNRPKRFLSEDLLVNAFNGNRSEFNDFETDYEVVQGDPDTETAKYQQFDSKLDITVYTESFKALLVQALNNAGLSPQSVGVTGLESLSASEGTQREKEKTTLRTRELKLGLWRQALSDLFERLLQFDDVVVKGGTAGEYEIAITFNDYAIPSLDARIATAGEALNKGLVDIRKSVDMTFLDDMSPDEKVAMVLNIKVENGIPLTADDVLAQQEQQ